MAYHGVLDWRLGISLLKVLNSKAYNAGLDGDFSTPELMGWLELATNLRDSFCRNFTSAPKMFGSLPGFVTSGGQNVVIIHPLWDRTQPTGWLAEAFAACGPEPPWALDTFNLLRRQSWSYQSLAQ